MNNDSKGSLIGRQKKTRLLIIGGSSTLGRVIVRKALADWQVLATYWKNSDPLDPYSNKETTERCQLDIRKRDEVEKCMVAFRPDVIIHTAGSNQSDDMEQVITLGARNITRSIAGSNTRLIHLSTDVVFNGQNAPYDETAAPSPIHAYGRAKAESEAIVTKDLTDFVIIRTSLIYSLTGQDHQSAWMKRVSLTNNPVTLFTDEFRCPVWVESLADACLELASNPFSGILHVAGDQRQNRWEFGKSLFRAWGIPTPPTIRPGEMPDRLVMTRPKDCTLDINLAKNILNTPLPGVDDVLSFRQE
ncbi:MAG: SDR family oxidoreductase [Anaerolineales bacterium]|nr:SDR family oxidoreductase [Anaerolineales bacterium]